MIIIDRFEGEFAVCESDGGMIDIKRSLLPDDAREGSVITQKNGKYVIDADAENARKSRLFDMQNELFGK